MFIAGRVNKLPSVVAFSATYFGLLTAASIFGSPLAVADTFREPMTGAAMYFAFFMLSDPPTTPARASDQVWFSMAVAVVSLVSLALTSSAVYYLLVRRSKRARTTTSPRLSPARAT